MTEQDRTAIITMRENGASFSAIARTLDVPLGTVKTVCTRGQKTNTFTGTFCLNCGTPIRNSSQGKRFCSRHCYNKWWHANHSVRTLYHQTCPVCGQEFAVSSKKNQKYCSIACFQAGRKAGGAHE